MQEPWAESDTTPTSLREHHRAKREERLPRLRSRDVVRSFLNDVLELDLPILRTVVDLTIRPGRLCRAYIDGYRWRYSNPLRYAFLMSAVMALVYTLLGTSPSAAIDRIVEDSRPVRAVDEQAPGAAGEVTPTDDEPAADQTSTEIKTVEDDTQRAERERLRRSFEDRLQWSVETIRANLHYIAFFMLPIVALMLRIFFRKAQLNFAEHYAFTLFVWGHGFLLTAAFGVIGLPETLTGFSIASVISLGYQTWAIRQFYGESWIHSTIKIIILTILHTAFSGCLGSILAMAIVLSGLFLL